MERRRFHPPSYYFQTFQIAYLNFSLMALTWPCGCVRLLHFWCEAFLEFSMSESPHVDLWKLVWTFFWAWVSALTRMHRNLLLIREWRFQMERLTSGWVCNCHVGREALSCLADKITNSWGFQGSFSLHHLSDNASIASDNYLTWPLSSRPTRVDLRLGYDLRRTVEDQFQLLNMSRVNGPTPFQSDLAKAHLLNYSWKLDPSLLLEDGHQRLREWEFHWRKAKQGRFLRRLLIEAWSYLWVCSDDLLTASGQGSCSYSKDNLDEHCLDEQPHYKL